MTVLKWLLIVLAVSYACGVAVLFFMQRSLLFPIPPVARTTPEAAGFPEAEEHILTTADDEKVIVWHVPAKPGHAVILYFPGNGDYLAGRISRFRGMTSDGTGLVALSYRGYAGSSGQPSERGILQDAAAAYAFTSARYAPDRIVVWGFSLGTGVAVALAAAQPIGKLILEAPYTSTADIAGSQFRWVPVRWLMRDPVHSDERGATVVGFPFTPSPAGLVLAGLLLVILFGTVFAAVHHAEVIAERIGEPYGTLLLTLAVTLIEVALIATIMLGEKPVPTLARDTVFAVVMIVCNGLVGICILAGGLRYREQDVQVTGSNLYLSVLIVLATITLILPNYTLTTDRKSTRLNSSHQIISYAVF